MERLLTQSEIEIILRSAKNPIYRMPGVISAFSNGDPLKIAAITPKRLIFIYGNQDTGLDHIMNRHGYFRDGSKWREENNEFLLDNPSQFSKNSKPIIDYKAIADMVFAPENKAESKHPEMFEKYTGISDWMEGKTLKYHLILYKNTRIVHTLFPDKKTFNRREKILNYKRGELKVTTTPLEIDLMASIPYYDWNNIIRYIVVIRLNNQTKALKTFVQVNNNYGEPLYSEPIAKSSVQKIMGPEEYFYAVANVDLSEVEKAIKRFDKEMSKRRIKSQLP